MEVYLHAFLTLALHGSEWPASCPDCFTPDERAPAVYLIGRWVGPRAGLDVLVEKKIPSLSLLGIESQSSSLQLCLYTD
jgi:hypothetical protein